MRVYVDSSALMKRVLDEPESDALLERLDELAADSSELVSSALARIEVSRSLKNSSVLLGSIPVGESDAAAMVGVSIVPISEEVVTLARMVGPRTLRSLDAIHCATAAFVEADAMLTYDVRLAAAALEIGMAVESPGAST